MKNIIFYFSGTGNCLMVAKIISKELNECEIISMAKPFILTEQYDRIGFIFPTYYEGLPKKVIEFIEKTNFENNKKSYYYSINT